MQWERAQVVEGDALTSRTGRIRNELYWLGNHDWAGRYTYPPDDGGLRIELAPESGFVWNTWSCTSGTHNHGEVLEVSPDLIRVRPVIQGLGSELFVRVLFLGRRFLVPAEDIENFARRVRNCDVWCTGLAHASDEEFDLDAPLQVPEQYRSLFDPRPITLVATHLLSKASEPCGAGTTLHTQTFFMNADRPEGVREGLRLECCEFEVHGATEVESVSARGIVGKLRTAYPVGVTPTLATVGTRFRTRGREELERAVAEYRTYREECRQQELEYAESEDSDDDADSP
jgi:hypothetical protein